MNCNHYVRFTDETCVRYGENSGITRSIRAKCGACGMDLAREDLKTSLLRIYSKDVTEIICTAFENKQKYLEATSALVQLGVTTIHRLSENSRADSEHIYDR